MIENPLTPYDTYFEGKQYGPQLFSTKTEDKMKTNKNLNSIAVKAIFDQVLNMDPA